MCSFLITNKDIEDLKFVNYYQKFRGPDLTNVLQREDITFVHNLLSINGAYTPQPFESERCTAIYNGEIYNADKFGTFSSDGQCLIPAFLEHGPLFARKLDGEFAAVIADHSSREIYFASDTFGTKPLYFGISGHHFAIASYPSVIQRMGIYNVFKVPANKIFSINYLTMRLIEVGEVTTFSLEQHKEAFDDWIDSFELSIRKRTRNVRESIFIGLSSGYDSGAISCILNRLDVPYSAYTISNNENAEVLGLRHQLFSAKSTATVVTVTEHDKQLASQRNLSAIEAINYQIYSSDGDYNEFSRTIHSDNGAIGLSIICSLAARNRQKIYLSGQGADEIQSDYGYKGQKIYRHSNFGGLFPDDLRSIFPWPSFFGSSQASYLMKDEHVAGSYGIEARYPFLDVRVVQEFLWLSARLKNAEYKSAIHELLVRYSYPFSKEEKLGFVP